MGYGCGVERLNGSFVRIGGKVTVCKVRSNCGEESGLEGVFHLSRTRGGSDNLVRGMGWDKTPGEELGGE